MAGAELFKIAPSVSITEMGTTSISITENKDCRVFLFRNKTGEGVISWYEMMPGVYLLLSDFHMKQMVSKIRHNADLLCLDYCCEGVMEWSLPNGSCLFQQAGELSVDDRKNITGYYHLPLSHYHAVTIVFFLPRAAISIGETFKGFPVDMSKLKEKFISRLSPYLIRNAPALSSYFKDIKNTKMHNWKTYVRIKIFELLLYLDAIDRNSLEREREYFYKSHVAKVKQMHEMMINDLEHHYTLDELSGQFKIPLTPMTKCFKGIYRKTIYSYMRDFRIKQAARQIRQTNISIADAALSVGYTNPSKFSSAFRKVIGKLPHDYRKQNAF